MTATQEFMRDPVAVLYIRTTVELADQVRIIAATARLPMSDVVEAIVSAALGIEHPHAYTVGRIANARKEISQP